MDDLDRSRPRPARIPDDSGAGPGDGRDGVAQPRLHLPDRSHPGLKELLTIGKIWELAQLDRKVRKARKYDLVLVDAPATGHGIGFMQTPRTFASIARVGPIHAQAEAIGAFITDAKQTGAAIVSLPEEMAVNESELLERELTEEVGVAVDRVYMNGMYPERISDDEAERLRGLRVRRGRRARRRAGRARRGRRATAHRAQLARLEELVRTPVETSHSSSSHSSGWPGSSAWRRRWRDGGRRRRSPRGQEGVHLRGIRRGRQDDHLGGDRGGDGSAARRSPC